MISTADYVQAGQCHVEEQAGKRLSAWSRSGGKRFFDCACVLAAMPLLAPLMLAIAVLVRLTSPGRILFLQKRAGRGGRSFTIAKFRTLVDSAEGTHPAVTTTRNQRFTPIGRFLRRWKLDELPQLANVLAGDMSLVGPRPKLVELTLGVHWCRPGITGAATLAFAREEAVLDRVPAHRLQACYHSVVLPAKQRIDTEYMDRATLLSDVKLLADTVLRRWDNSLMEALLRTEIQDAQSRIELSRASETSASGEESGQVPALSGVAQPESAAEISAYRRQAWANPGQCPAHWKYGAADPGSACNFCRDCDLSTISCSPV